MKETEVGDRVEFRPEWPPTQTFDLLGDVVAVGLHSVTVLTPQGPRTVSKHNLRPERYWIQPPEHWSEVNTQGVQASIEAGQLYAVVDEQCGGIIAYAVGESNATRLHAALRDAQ